MIIICDFVFDTSIMVLFHLFIQQKFTECLICARRSSGNRRHNSQKEVKSRPLENRT